MTKFSKLLAAVALATTTIASLAFAQVNSGDSYGRPQTLRFTRSAPTVDPSAMVYQDTITIVSAVDTIRTSNINTDFWDLGPAHVATTGTSPRAVALLALWASPAWVMTSYADSLYFVVEPSFDGGKTYINNYKAVADIGAPAIGNYALQTPVYATNGAAAGHGGTVYRGLLVSDNDTALTAALAAYQIFGIRDFRLKIFGDAGAAGSLAGAVFPLGSKVQR